MKPHELPRVLLAVARVLRDSTRTDEIIAVSEITGRVPYRRFLEQEADNPALRALLSAQPELGSAHLDYDALRALPPSTLGRCYVDFLDSNGLDADGLAGPTRFVRDPDISYLMRRFRQTHDLWHTLVGLGPAGHEEVLLHAFSFGQLHLPISALVVYFGTLKHIVLEARWRTLHPGILSAYRAGREAAPLLTVRWESMWELPITEVRRRFGIRALQTTEGTQPRTSSVSPLSSPFRATAADA